MGYGNDTGVDRQPDLRHETRAERQDNRAAAQFSVTVLDGGGAALDPVASCRRCGDQYGGCLWCRPVKLTRAEADVIDLMRHGRDVLKELTTHDPLD